MRARLAPLAIAALAPATLVSCDDVGSVFNGDCTAYATSYDADLAKSGELAPSIPTTPDNFPMALVLNTRAVNMLFQNLADAALPELSESIDIPILGALTVAIQPEIPLFAIGGDASCPTCFAADVPFNIGVGFNNDNPSTVGATLGVQMPVAMMPEDDRKTSLVASFQTLSVTRLEFESSSGPFADFANQIEDVTTSLLTGYLQSRFEDARIASFDSWAIGQGEVLLAGRGPFVFPEQGTVMIAMQSNLKIDDGTTLEQQSQLADGADIGFVFHPNLLLSMSRRMHYEGVIPQNYDQEGNALTSNATGDAALVSLQSMRTTDDNLLNVGARLFRTNNLCGTADLTANLGLTVEPGTFAFTVQDVDITDGQGIGSLFTNDAWGASGFVDSLVETLDFTVNYDQVFGGEQAEQPTMAPIQFNIDGRGLSVFLNVVDEG